MAIPFHGTQATLAGGPGHSVWFTSLISSDAPVEVAPDTTMEGTTNETFFGYFNSSGSPVLVSHDLQLPFQKPTQPVPQLVESGLDAEGNFWSLQDHGLERTSPTGTVTEFPTGIPHPREEHVIGGPEGDLWFTTEERVAGIGRVTPSGHVTIVSDGISGQAGQTSGLAFGSEGRLWFTTGSGRVGSLSPTGPPRVKLVSSPHKAVIGLSIARGTGGDLWSIEGRPTRYLVRITPAGQATRMCKVNAIELVSGIDGNVWFLLANETGHSVSGVGHIDPHGNVTEYHFGHRGLGTPIPGPEGDVWLTAFPELTPAQERPGTVIPPSKILRISPHERSTRVCRA